MKTISESLKRLKAGNLRFVQDAMEHGNLNNQHRETIISGQNPFAIILSCADSRVVPEHIFDAGLGDLFVVGVAGNVANTSSIASIEFAVAHLGTPIIVVLGHQSCGAVTAAMKGGDNGFNLNHLLAHIEPAIRESGEHATIDDVAIKNAHLTAQALCDRSPIIRNAITSQKLEIVPAYYHLKTGVVDFLK